MDISAAYGVVSLDVECLRARPQVKLYGSASASGKGIAAGLVYFHVCFNFRICRDSQLECEVA